MHHKECPTVWEWPNQHAKTGFQNFLDRIFEFDWFFPKTSTLWSLSNVEQDLLFRKLNISIFVKNGFEICSNRVWHAFPHVSASEKPHKLCLNVYLGSVETLKAPVIEISWAENIYFTKNLLHCTATSTPKNENWRLGNFCAVSFWIKFKNV